MTPFRYAIFGSNAMQANSATTDFWHELKQEAKTIADNEPLLASYIHACILTHHNFESSLSFILSNKVADDVMPALAIREVLDEAYLLEPQITESAIEDIEAIHRRDAAVEDWLTPLLYFKGFQAVQIHRIAHYLWNKGRRQLALFLQSRNSVTFGVDIHPAARIGKGVMFDHATGIVVGETAVIEDHVSLLQSVTLGGTGHQSGDRHPKVRQGVLVGAGAKILGNIEVGEGSKVGAGSVVLSDVPPNTTVVGVPAKVVGRPTCPRPCDSMRQNVLEDNV